MSKYGGSLATTSALATLSDGDYFDVEITTDPDNYQITFSVDGNSETIGSSASFPTDYSPDENVILYFYATTNTADTNYFWTGIDNYLFFQDV